MKILFFNYEYPPLGGGAATATEYILREFSKYADLEVDLVTSSIDDRYHLEKIGENVRIHRLPIGKNANNLHFQSQKDLLFYIWRSYNFSRHLIGKSKIDKKPFTLTHSFFTVPCGFVSMLLRWQFKLPYIVSLRGSDVPGYSDRFIFIYKLATPLFKLIWKKASRVISCSSGLRELAIASGTKKAISVIPNGINIEKFKPAPESRPKDRFIVMPGASRVTDRKGLIYLINAIRKLSPKYPELRLKIIGDGNARQKLERVVKDFNLEDKVEFLGYIPRNNNLEVYYQEAQLFVLPSLNEGMSNAMLEALAVGLPIISTNTGGATELVMDGQNGFIIKFKDSDDIADKIEALILDGSLRQKMSLASRRLAEKMSWENVAEKYYRAYRKVGEKN